MKESHGTPYEKRVVARARPRWMPGWLEQLLVICQIFWLLNELRIQEREKSRRTYDPKLRAGLTPEGWSHTKEGRR